MPQDVEAERAVLGAMLQEKEAIGEVVRVLRDAGAAAFQVERHQQLYDVLVKLYVDDQPIDGVVIKDELVRRGLWEKVGQFDFLAELVSAVPSALRAAHYAGVVYDKYLLRQLVTAAHRVVDRALEQDLPAREVLDYAEKEIFDVTERRVSGEAQLLHELIAEAFRTIERRGRDALTGEPTGFIELDELTCGLQPGELIIVAGRPSMGKTALGLNMAEHLGIVEQRPVLFFSLEMSRQQVAQRILCSRARVNSHTLRRGRHTAEDLKRLQEAADELTHAPLLVDDTSDLTVLELRARARMARRRHDIRAIFVDYLQLMRAPRSENRQVEVANISRGLKALAKDLNVPVVAMAQLNRSPEDKTRRGNRPRMSDLRESGAIEQDADVVALLHREAYYKTNQARVRLGDEDEAPPGVEDPEENVAELIIAKQRNGPVDTIKLHWNKQYTRFDNHLPGRPTDSPHPRLVPTPF
ncbi:MAG: replicative DNA helicase [Planctomycetota bacterium]